MSPSILGLLTRAIATVYGLLALGVSVLYSLSRKDTWTRPSETTVSDFQNSCRKLWSLSDEEGDLSHNFLTLQNGLQLHYLSPKSTPQSCKALVIFLHGFPDSSYLWEQYLQSGLAQKAKLVALDLPGCGGSDSHSFYGPDEILNAVAEAIVQVKRRYLNQPEASSSPMKTILISHDWGGVIAFRLAGETSSLIDEVVVLNSTYPRAAREHTASLLNQCWEAISTRRFRDALPPLKIVAYQLLLSNYIFMFNLRLPLAKWMPWLASSLVKVSNEISLQNSRRNTPAAHTQSLTASYGPSPSEVTTTLPNGATYGATVRLRAQTKPQGDWDGRVRIYSEGLALGTWHPNYQDYQPPAWKSAPESSRKGSFNYPVHVLFGMRDIALEPGLVLDGIASFMQDGGAEGRDLGSLFERGVKHEVIGGSSIIRLPLCGHWSMMEAQGQRTLMGLLNVLIERSA